MCEQTCVNRTLELATDLPLRSFLDQLVATFLKPKILSLSLSIYLSLSLYLSIYLCISHDHFLQSWQVLTFLSLVHLTVWSDDHQMCLSSRSCQSRNMSTETNSASRHRRRRHFSECMSRIQKARPFKSSEIFWRWAKTPCLIIREKDCQLIPTTLYNSRYSNCSIYSIATNGLLELNFVNFRSNLI